MRRFFSALFSFAVLATALVLPGNAATGSVTVPPVGSLLIVRVGTDAMGTDNFDNRNREFIRFKNVSGANVDLTGVYTEDNWAHENNSASTCNTYKFPGVGLPDSDLDGNSDPDGFMLAPGQYVNVYNGSRIGGNYYDTAIDTYKMYADSDTDCGTFGHYFNNDADKVWMMHGPGPTTVLHAKDWDWGGGYFIVF